MKKIIVSLLFCFIFINTKNETPKMNTEYINIIHISHFNAAYERIRQWEGWYVNHPNDKGGETYAGITRIYNPEWYGWRYVKDSLYKNKVVPKAEMWVKDYYLNIWVKEGFYRIKNEQLAIYLFDIRIQSSRRTIIRILNSTIWELNYRYSLKNREDWVTDFFNYTDPMTFTNHLRDRRIKFYNSLVNKDSTQRTFLKGWLRRAKDVS